MISRINGVLVSKEADWVEVATSGGVTYSLAVPVTVFPSLPPVGQEVELYTAMLGREDGLDLFGFTDQLQRELFLRLKSASGVGPRLALTLLGAMSVAQLVEAIRARDLGRLQAVNGVGKKKAERIAVELGDKLDDMVSVVVESEPASVLADSAVSALVALGYPRTEAENAVRRALKSQDGADHDVETLVRGALATLS